MRRTVNLLASVVLVATACSSAKSHGQPRFTSPLVPPLVRVSQRLGVLPADRRLSVQVLLPSGADIQGAEAFLRRQHLEVSDLRSIGLLLAAGTVRDLDATFGVRLDQWRYAPTGETYYANDRPPVLPFQVDGIFGLDDAVRPQPLIRSSPCINVGSDGCPSGLSAAQLRKAYNADVPGADGTGQRVAIFATSGVSMKDIKKFDEQNGLTDPQINVNSFKGPLALPASPGAVTVPVPFSGPDIGPQGGAAETEADLDIETVHAIAPGAVIDLYEMDAINAPDASVVLFLIAAASFGEHIASISYGFCESDLGAAASGYQGLTQRIVQQLGVTVLAGSGDTGQYCVGNTGDRVGVNYPASDPFVTAVGGTHLDLTANDTLNSEQAWDQPNVEFDKTGLPSASGGGPVAQPAGLPAGSTFPRSAPPWDPSSFPRPAWQVAAGMASGSQRMVPDVSADADASSGLSVYQTGTWQKGNGTSQSTPIWAGVVARYDQVASAQHAPTAGFLNPVLYQLAGGADRALLDVTTDQDGGIDLAGHAGPGWDPATGLGSPNAAELIHDGIQLGLAGAPVPYTDLRTVDWANITVPADACGTSGPVLVHDGRATVASSRFPGFPQILVWVPTPVSVGLGVTYGDLDGAGHDDAALLVVCDTGGGTGGSGLADNLVIYSGGNGPHPIGVLHTILRSGNRAGRFSQGSVRLALHRVFATEVGYAPGDPQVGPTLTRADAWSWNGHDFPPCGVGPC